MDTWFTYSGILETNKNQNNCYGYLTEELIDNTYDDDRRVNRSVRDPIQKLNIDLQLSLPIKNDGSGRCGLSIHLTPRKRKRLSNK